MILRALYTSDHSPLPFYSGQNPHLHPCERRYSTSIGQINHLSICLVRCTSPLPSLHLPFIFPSERDNNELIIRFTQCLRRLKHHSLPSLIQSLPQAILIPSQKNVFARVSSSLSNMTSRLRRFDRVIV